MNITNDIVTEYIQKFYVPIDENFSVLRQNAEKCKVPIILRETESFLTFLLGLLKPKNVLEIGTAIGYSAMVFASFGANVITIEKDQDMVKTAINNINTMGFSDKIKVLNGDGEVAIKENLDENDMFDLIFIDAAKSHYQRFLDAAIPFCSKNSIIVSDNVLLKAATASDQFDPKGRFKTNIRKMRQYLEYISDHPKLDTIILSCGDGLALSRYK